MDEEIDPKRVAEWMASALEQKQTLYQSDAVEAIQKNFGKGFVVENDNGTFSIDRKVLDEFRSLTATTAVWERSGKFWRTRTATDAEGRQAS